MYGFWAHTHVIDNDTSRFLKIESQEIDRVKYTNFRS